jgi:putative transposase
MAVSFKGAHFPKDITRMGVRWYVAYPLSTRHIEELMGERGVHVDHSTINRWVITYSPPLEEAFHRRKWPIWVSWRMDETESVRTTTMRISQVIDMRWKNRQKCPLMWH